jgi:large subunit ribosomal protein L17
VWPRAAASAKAPAAAAANSPLEKMITLAKRDTLHSRRVSPAFLDHPATVQKLFDKLGTRFGRRNGGYSASFGSAFGRETERSR